MLLLKTCPRCRRGDLIVEREEYGVVVDCLQCGYVGDLSAVRRFMTTSTVAHRLPERERAEVA
ncbi:MAG: hypothetical protein A2148_07635 [Chloroflexi bacterium RBG_16_68_14]|nr:MAG: hypothetical protein A2148_07635 [Chloroflexi bacterium RBG_16_68_14]